MNMKFFGNESGEATVELYSDREAVISGCKSVLDYTENGIELNMGDRLLHIKGEDLVIRTFVFEQIDVSGKIKSLEFFEV